MTRVTGYNLSRSGEECDIFMMIGEISAAELLIDWVSGSGSVIDSKTVLVASMKSGKITLKG